MAEATLAAPPSGAANQFNHTADQALAEARSPMEAAADNASAFPNPVVPAEFSSKLDAARRADTERQNAQMQGRNQNPPPAKPQETARPAEASEPSEPSNPLDWKPKDKRKSDNWEALKAERDTYKAELDTFKKQTAAQPKLEDLTKHPEYAKLKAERDEFYNIVKDVAVERDPEFNAKFEPKVEAAIKAAKFAAGGNAEKLEKLLRKESTPERDLAIEELLRDSSETTKRKVSAALMHLDQIDIERQSEIAARKANFEARQLDQFKQQEQSQRERQAKIERAFEATTKKWMDPEEGMPLLIKRDGDEKWNREVDKSLQLARDIFSGQKSEQELAQAALWASVGQKALELAQETAVELEKANAYIQKLQGVQPGDGGYNRTASGTPAVDVTDPIQYHDTFAAGLDEARSKDFRSKGW